MSTGRLKYYMLLALMGTVMAGTTPVWAAPLNLPVTGAVFEGQQKQDYISNQMKAVFGDSRGSEQADFQVPDGWTWNKYTVGTAKVEHMQAVNGDSRRVLFQLHGGGYVLPLGDSHRLLAIKQATLMGASDVYALDYRIAPEYVYPSALEDAVAAYRDLLNKGINPKNILIVGDSAGGNLVLELALYLKEHNIPQPAGLALASPWATFEDIKKSSRTFNEMKDQVLGAGTPLAKPVKDAAYGAGLNRKDPRISPMYADLSGLPPMLVQTGGNEVFLTENQDLVNKAVADGVEVTFTVYPGMPHDFALLLPYMKESVDSLNEIKDFADRTMKSQEVRVVTEKPTVGLYEFGVPDEQIAVFDEQGRRNFTSSMAKEPNTLTMNTAHVKDNPNKSFVLEAYTNDAALAEHRASGHFKEYVTEIGSKLADRKAYNLEPQALLEQPGATLTVDDKNALVNLVKVTVKPEFNDAFKAVVLPEMVESIEKDRGVLVMYALTDKEKPNEWYFYEIYRDEAAYQHHREEPYFQDYLTKTADMLEDEKVFYSLVLDVAAWHGGLRYVNP